MPQNGMETPPEEQAAPEKPLARAATRRQSGVGKGALVAKRALPSADGSGEEEEEDDEEEEAAAIATRKPKALRLQPAKPVSKLQPKRAPPATRGVAAAIGRQRPQRGGQGVTLSGPKAREEEERLLKAATLPTKKAATAPAPEGTALPRQTLQPPRPAAFELPLLVAPLAQSNIMEPASGLPMQQLSNGAVPEMPAPVIPSVQGNFMQPGGGPPVQQLIQLQQPLQMQWPVQQPGQQQMFSPPPHLMVHQQNASVFRLEEEVKRMRRDMEWNEQRRRADDQAAREESDRRAMCQRFGLF